MPSLQKITNWLFHLKTDQDAMAQQTGKPTHVILWRYKELKPLKKTLEKLGFKDFVVKVSFTIRCSISIPLMDSRLILLGLQLKPQIPEIEDGWNQSC